MAENGSRIATRIPVELPNHTLEFGRTNQHSTICGTQTHIIFYRNPHNFLLFWSGTRGTQVLIALRVFLRYGTSGEMVHESCQQGIC